MTFDSFDLEVPNPKPEFLVECLRAVVLRFHFLLFIALESFMAGPTFWAWTPHWPLRVHLRDRKVDLGGIKKSLTLIFAGMRKTSPACVVITYILHVVIT